MKRDNPEYHKIYEKLSTKKYVWVCRYHELKRIRITKIEWIPNPNNPRHPCIIRTGTDAWGPSYTHDEVYLTKEKCMAKLRKENRALMELVGEMTLKLSDAQKKN